MTPIFSCLTIDGQTQCWKSIYDRFNQLYVKAKGRLNITFKHIVQHVVNTRHHDAIECRIIFCQVIKSFRVKSNDKLSMRPNSKDICTPSPWLLTAHYDDVIMTAMASQITSLTIVYSIVYSGTDQRKHQSSASLAFVRGIHRGPVNSPHKGPVTRKMFPFDDVIMQVIDHVSQIEYFHCRKIPVN